MSTEQVCRTLRAYRKKLHESSEHLRSQRELEHELSLTLHSLNTHAKGFQEPAETETESSGKENERMRPVSAVSGKAKTMRLPHRMPSMPHLGQKSVRETCRSRSLDADGEG